MKWNKAHVVHPLKRDLRQERIGRKKEADGEELKGRTVQFYELSVV